MKRPDSIEWLAGLLEGEGTFCYSRNGTRHTNVRLSMTDEDIVRRAAAVMSAKVRGPYCGGRDPRTNTLGIVSRKPLWTCDLTGDRGKGLIKFRGRALQERNRV